MQKRNRIIPDEQPVRTNFWKWINKVVNELGKGGSTINKPKVIEYWENVIHHRQCDIAIRKSILPIS
jgi:hypothetical protein